MNPIGQFKNALRLARESHEGQFRKGPDREKFINHPRRVCKAYLRFRHKTTTGAIASLCHDLVEDTKVSPGDLERYFDVNVKNLVGVLTKPQGLSSRQYGAFMRDWSLESRKIKVCDIEDNIISSLRIDPARRSTMLNKWRYYLDRLGENLKNDSSNESREFRQKLREIYELCDRELRGTRHILIGNPTPAP